MTAAKGSTTPRDYATDTGRGSGMVSTQTLTCDAGRMGSPQYATRLVVNSASLANCGSQRSDSRFMTRLLTGYKFDASPVFT